MGTDGRAHADSRRRGRVDDGSGTNGAEDGSGMNSADDDPGTNSADDDPGTNDDTDSGRQRVFEELVAEIQAQRGGDHAADMAAALLRHARGSTALVALVDGCRRAVCYCANARTLAAVPFDRHGVDAADATRVWRSLDDPTTWLDAADAVDWVHPRYRSGGRTRASRGWRRP